MKKIILFIIILFFCNQVQASWSTFAHVTPFTAGKYNIGLLFESESQFEGDYQIDRYLLKVDAVDYDRKSAWLIITSDELSIKGQESLRSCEWYSTKPEKEIILKTQLKFKESKDKNGNVSKHYEIELDFSKIENAYIYIDFPSEVKDGGYYYSVDLNAFFKHMMKS